MRLYTLCVVGCTLAACGADAVPEPSRASEHGRWVVIGATRGGQATNTLDAAYFEFDTALSTLKTNFTGQEETLAYTANDTAYLTPEGELYRSIRRRVVGDSMLELATVIQGTGFTFRLVPDASAQAPAVIQPGFPVDSTSAPLDDDPGDGGEEL